MIRGSGAPALAPRDNPIAPVSVTPTMSARRGGARVALVPTTATQSLQSIVDAARQAEASCGAMIRDLESVGELSLAFDLFNRIWGGDDQGAMPVNVMRALEHSRNYVVGAWNADRLVGASVGFAWGEPAARCLHSHISGVVPDAQGRGVGYALKLHQRAWAAERGLARITWTFDPLIRRNAWFNLAKLGARIEEYQSDFYGPMNDGINGGDVTDRCVAVWDVADAGVNPGGLGQAPAGTLVLLSCGTDDEPVLPDGAAHAWKEAPALSCQVPADAVGLRRADANLAKRWRLALRDSMGAAIRAGFVASSITNDGCYILERGTSWSEVHPGERTS